MDAVGGFERFFQVTPQDLIDKGLYKPVAIELLPPPHDQVSAVLLAIALGASTGKPIAGATAGMLLSQARKAKLVSGDAAPSFEECIVVHRKIASNEDRPLEQTRPLPYPPPMEPVPSNQPDKQIAILEADPELTA